MNLTSMRHTLALAGALGVLSLGACQHMAKQQDLGAERIVFLGDSITDGFTYPLLLRQALADAGRPAPVCINAGIAGDTAAGMRARLARDVLAHRPTLMTLMVGLNDVMRKVPPADYERDVAAILDEARAARLPVLLLTTTCLGPKHTAVEPQLAEYNTRVRRLAQRDGVRLVEINGPMTAARDRGEPVLEADQVHLTFAGYRVLTRVLLDALGAADLPVPTELRLAPLPGLVREWRLLARPKGTPPLTDAAVAALAPDETWARYALPEATAAPHWWEEQCRQLGYAVNLKAAAGEAPEYVGVATLTSDGERRVYLNTGAALQRVWLNDVELYRNAGWTGYHAGKERLAATLRPGANRLVILTGGQFFLSVTATNDW